MNIKLPGSSIEKSLVKMTLFIVAVAGLILAVVPWLVMEGASTGQAYHYETWNNPRTHNRHVHFASSGHGVFDEDFCVQSHDPNMSYSTLSGRVTSTLMYASTHWDGTANWRVDFYVAAECNDDPAVEFEYHTYANNSGNCGSDDLSCVTHVSPVYTSTYNHYDYWYEYAWLDTHNIDGAASEYHQTLNLRLAFLEPTRSRLLGRLRRR